MARGCAHGMRRSGRGTFQSLSTLSPCSLICASRSLPVTVAHSALAPLGASKCTQHPGENTETVQMTGDGMALKHADVHARDVRGAQARACLQRRTFGINEVRRSRVAYATSTWGDATSAAQRQSLAMSCRASLCDAWYRTGGQPRAPAAQRRGTVRVTRRASRGARRPAPGSSKWQAVRRQRGTANRCVSAAPCISRAPGGPGPSFTAVKLNEALLSSQGGHFDCRKKNVNKMFIRIRSFARRRTVRYVTTPMSMMSRGNCREQGHAPNTLTRRLEAPGGVRRTGLPHLHVEAIGGRTGRRR